MITHLSKMTARYIARNDESADYDVLVYGYELLYQELAVHLLTLIIALPFGIMPYVLAGLILFKIIRNFTGGAHANHRVVCTIVSTSVLFGPSLVFVKLGFRIPVFVIGILFVLDLLLLAKYAPADTELKPIQSPDKRAALKRMAILSLFAVFIVSFFLWRVNPGFAEAMVVTVTIVCLFTHPAIYKLLGCKNSMTTEVTTA